MINNSRVDALNLAIDSDNQIYVNNRSVTPKFVTVEIEEGGHWHKFYMHHGRVGAVSMTNCKFIAFHGLLHVFVNGAEVKSSKARFEVVSS